MNHVERFRAVMNFQSVDRLPRIEWATWWNRTIDRWRDEGMPRMEWFDIQLYFGLDPYRHFWLPARGPNCPDAPAHGMPIVSTMDEYIALLPHLYGTHDEALTKMAQYAPAQARGEEVIWITCEGFFWHPRTLLGIEGHLYGFYDQPELMHRMNHDHADHLERLIQRLPRFCLPTFMTFAEDMSYNNGPMLSKVQFEEFIAPHYRRIVPMLKELNIIPIVDSDGDVSDLAGWLLEAGISGILPLERQAGVDGLGLRKTYPRLMMIGHYDKMVMPQGEAAMRAEFERLLPVMKGGGFIPSVDHQTPPGVSLENYRIYLRLLSEYTVSGRPG